MADIVAGFALADRDLDLVEELRLGSEDAFTTLLSMYQQPVYNLVFRLLNDPADAPDVTQEVFLKVFRGIGEFRGQCSLRTWIYRIAMHESFNLRRWAFRHRRRELSLEEKDTGGYSVAANLRDEQESQYDRLLRKERMEAVGRALAGLNSGFRTAVVLRDLEGLSYEEIAEVMQVSLGTVKSRILRGREALKEKLAALETRPAETACPAEAME